MSSGMSVFFIQNRWTDGSSNTNTIPASSASSRPVHEPPRVLLGRDRDLDVKQHLAPAGVDGDARDDAGAELGPAFWPPLLHAGRAASTRREEQSSKDPARHAVTVSSNRARDQPGAALPLAGWRVLVTRPAEQAGAAADRAARGWCGPARLPDGRGEAAARLVAVRPRLRGGGRRSLGGVHQPLGRAARAGAAARNRAGQALAAATIAAVGPGTARALEPKGCVPRSSRPRTSSARRDWWRRSPILPPGPRALPAGARRPRSSPGALAARGIAVEVLPVSQTVALAALPDLPAVRRRAVRQPVSAPRVRCPLDRGALSARPWSRSSDRPLHAQASESGVVVGASPTARHRRRWSRRSHACAATEVSAPAA